MKRPVINIISFLLLSILLFTQVGTGFLHHHEYKQNTEELTYSKSSAKLCKDSELCKICSLQLFHNLFFQEIHPFKSFKDFQKLFITEKPRFTSSLVFSITGRGPPSFI